MITLAEALLRRKELTEKVAHLKQINQEGLFEVQVKRGRVTDSMEDLVAKVPKISLQQVTAAYDWHARRLRLIDAIIQQANWNTQVELKDETIMDDYVDPYVEDKRK
jgi:hypothetical protein